MQRAVAWVVGSALVALSGVFAYLREDDESVAYALGAAVGTVLLNVGAAALFALLVVNLGGRGRVFSPWVMLGAGLFALFSTAVLVQDAQGTT